MAEEKNKGASLNEAIAAQEKMILLEQELLALEGKKGKKATERKKILNEQIKSNKTLIENSKAFIEYNKKINKGTLDFSRSYSKLSKDVKKNLGGELKNSSILASINTKRVQLEAKAATLKGDELAAAQEMIARLNEQEISLISQAKQTTRAEEKARGLNDLAIELKELEEEIAAARKEGNDELVETLELEKQGLELKKQMSEKEARLESIQESQKEIMGALPEGVQQAVSFGKKLTDTLKVAGKAAGGFMIIAAVVTTALATFVELDNAAAEFRKETGLTNSQMEGIRSNANEIAGEFANIGLKSTDVFNTVAALKKEFSDITDFSKEASAALSVLSVNFGVAPEAAAKVQSQLVTIGGLSQDTAANVQMQVAEMANLAGVAPAKVFEDMAENAETTSKFFKGDVKLLAEQAIQARRLGTNLKAVAETAEKLLDFESGIEEELTAATFVGGQFNLSRARALAFEGKLVEAQEETLRQIQRSGDFRKKDFFTQQQLAKAANMSVEEINKQLDAQEKLSSLSAEQKKAAEDAINAGLDISNISKENLASEVDKFSVQQEQQKTLDKISNQFTAIASTIGSVLVPVLDAVALALEVILFPITLINDMFGFIGEKISSLIGPLGTVGKFLKGLAGLAVIYAAYSAYASLSAIPVVGSVLGGIAAAAIIAAGFATLSKIGDMSSPADGKTRVSTKEGGLFELSPNDDLVAAPGAIDALNGATNVETGLVGERGSSPNLAVLSAPLNAMINEIKALRADLNAGKIAVYMDTSKVTSNIGKSVDQNTRNSYNLGSA